MPSLFDTIKQNQSAAASQATAGATQASEQNVTGQTQRLLQAKTGKAVAPGSAPRISNVGEQQANAQTALGGQALAQQVQQGQQALQTQVAQQGQGIAQAQQEQTFEAKKQETDYLRNEDAILDQYLQGTKKLDLSKDKAKFEQMGFQMRATDQQYMDNLGREAQRAQLDNDLKFKEEMARTVFAEEGDLFQDNMDFRSAMFSDKQDFIEQMSNMDLDYAIQMGTFANQQASANSMFTGVGQVTSGGIKAYGAYKNKHPDAEESEESDTAEKAAPEK